AHLPLQLPDLRLEGGVLPHADLVLEAERVQPVAESVDLAPQLTQESTVLLHDGLSPPLQPIKELHQPAAGGERTDHRYQGQPDVALVNSSPSLSPPPTASPESVSALQAPAVAERRVCGSPRESAGPDP